MSGETEPRWFVKKPCKHCPFLRTMKMFATVCRAEDFAYMTDNPYTSFHCHKTGDVDDDDTGDFVPTQDSLECAGFLTLKVNSGTIECPEGFTPSKKCFDDSDDMISTYEDWADKGEVGHRIEDEDEE